MKKIINTFICLSCMFSSILFSQGKGVGEGAAPFLAVPVGARAAAMGSAYSALASDVIAAYWNPAGLGRLQGLQLATTISSLGGELGQEIGAHRFFGLGYASNIGTFALSIISQGINDIEIWPDDEQNFEPSGTIQFSQNAFIISYGKAIFPNVFYIGINWKIIHLSLWDQSATGFDGIDIGLLYRPFERLFLSAVVKKQVSLRWQIGADGHTDYVPKMGTMGVAYQFIKNDATLSVDMHQEEDFPLNMRMGVEYVLHSGFGENGSIAMQGLSFRGGFQHIYFGQASGENGNSFKVNQKGLGFNFGLGIEAKVANINLNLDWSYGSQYLMSVNRLSVSCQF